MNLRQYGEEVVGATGIPHQLKLNALRVYMKQTPIEQLRKEVGDIVSRPVLKAIWEAGVPKGLQEEYFKQIGGQI